MIALGREKLMQHMLLGVDEVTEQCVVVVLSYEDHTPASPQIQQFSKG